MTSKARRDLERVIILCIRNSGIRFEIYRLSKHYCVALIWESGDIRKVTVSGTSSRQNFLKDVKRDICCAMREVS